MSSLEEIVARFKPGKEQIYVEARLRGLGANAAALASGLNPRYEFDHPVVKAAIEEFTADVAPRISMTRERLTEMLLDTYRNADTAGEQVAAVRELGKLHGLYAPTQVKVDTHHTVERVRQVSDMRTLTVEQLEALVHARGRDVIEGELVSQRQLGHD